MVFLLHISTPRDLHQVEVGRAVYQDGCVAMAAGKKVKKCLAVQVFLAQVGEHRAPKADAPIDPIAQAA